MTGIERDVISTRGTTSECRAFSAREQGSGAFDATLRAVLERRDPRSPTTRMHAAEKRSRAATEHGEAPVLPDAGASAAAAVAVAPSVPRETLRTAGTPDDTNDVASTTDATGPALLGEAPTEDPVVGPVGAAGPAPLATPRRAGLDETANAIDVPSDGEADVAPLTGGDHSAIAEVTWPAGGAEDRPTAPAPTIERSRDPSLLAASVAASVMADPTPNAEGTTDGVLSPSTADVTRTDRLDAASVPIEPATQDAPIASMEDPRAAGDTVAVGSDAPTAMTPQTIDEPSQPTPPPTTTRPGPPPLADGEAPFDAMPVTSPTPVAGRVGPPPPVSQDVTGADATSDGVARSEAVRREASTATTTGATATGPAKSTIDQSAAAAPLPPISSAPSSSASGPIAAPGPDLRTAQRVSGAAGWTATRSSMADDPAPRTDAAASTASAASSSDGPAPRALEVTSTSPSVTTLSTMVPSNTTTPRMTATSTSQPVTSSPSARSAVAEQLVSVVRPLTVADGAHSMTIDLHPADLGRVRLEITVEGGTVHVTMHADRRATAALLDESTSELRRTLDTAGLSAGRLDIGTASTGLNGRNPSTGPEIRSSPFGSTTGGLGDQSRADRNGAGPGGNGPNANGQNESRRWFAESADAARPLIRRPGPSASAGVNGGERVSRRSVDVLL